MFFLIGFIIYWNFLVNALVISKMKDPPQNAKNSMHIHFM